MRIHTSLMALLLAAGSLAAQAPVASLEVFPPDINLHTARGRQSFVVKVTQSDGITRDVTAQANLRLANPAVVKLEKNVLSPLADGVTDPLGHPAYRAEPRPGIDNRHECLRSESHFPFLAFPAPLPRSASRWPASSRRSGP